MGPRQLSQPFGDEPYDEVDLPRAPLVRVLSQLRFERMSVLDSPSTAGEFTVALSDVYPYSDSSTELNLLVGGGQVASQPTSQTVWRLRSADRTRTVTLTNGAISLETSNYSGRGDFCKELLSIVEVLHRIVKVPSFNRIGVRYTNQITGDLLHRLSDLFRAEILGLSSTSLGNAQLQHAVSQASFILGGGTGLVGQWGQLPENSGFDPGLPVLPQRSYVLDLDAYLQNDAINPSPTAIQAEALALAERAYRFLRWAVTLDFLREFGGDV
ncbi:TIGR04255 family protein [Streptomyces sp. GESEQ-35]|uniref:TIGR04255 family protein n=1 Tax=Streptomyces sp. GESEQ-35 TaxID=2812657 RepID=UPI001B3232D2|nr:TIGR04255 family protein [Streptomyces sp. GESEQ-35]